MGGGGAFIPAAPFLTGISSSNVFVFNCFFCRFTTNKAVNNSATQRDFRIFRDEVLRLISEN